MSKQFDNILDECLEQIRKGEMDVEACLAKYPQFASELKPLLEAAVLLSQTHTPEPSPAAFSRGQVRLREALEKRRVLRSQESFRERSTPIDMSLVKRVLRTITPSLSWRAAPVAAGIAAFMIVVAGAQAAGRSLPGEPLYGVKLASESARLALARSDIEKANLNINLAGQRLEEAAKVARKGDPEQITKLAQAVAGHLKEAEGFAGADKPEGTAASVGAKLESSAIKQLARLQDALETAPKEAQSLLGEVLQTSGAQYASSIETVARTTPPPAAKVVSAKGTLQIVATDPPPPSVDQVLIQVDKIEANKARGPEGEWVTLIEAPATFDLVKIASVRKLLGSVEAEAGTFTQIRMKVAKATAIVGSSQFDVRIPSDTLTFVRPFQVKEGETTTILMDFDGSESLHITGNNQYMLRPVVRLLVEQTDKGVDQDKAKDREKTKTKEAKEAKVEIEGIIQEAGKNQIVISGQRIVIDARTELRGSLQGGHYAVVEAVVQPNGSFLAKKIEVKEESRQNKENKGRDKETETGKTPKPQEQQERNGKR